MNSENQTIEAKPADGAFSFSLIGTPIIFHGRIIDGKPFIERAENGDINDFDLEYKESGEVVIKSNLKPLHPMHTYSV